MNTKTDRYYVEKYGGPVIALSVAIFNYFNPNILSCKDPTVFIAKSVDISFIIFGFLLTVLALIMQSNAEIKARILYKRLINYNRRIVFVSIALGFYSMIYSSLFTEITSLSFHEIFVSLFSLLFIWVVIDLVHFILIFYKLAGQQKI